MLNRVRIISIFKLYFPGQENVREQSQTALTKGSSLRNARITGLILFLKDAIKNAINKDPFLIDGPVSF